MGHTMSEDKNWFIGWWLLVIVVLIAVLVELC